MIGDLQQKVTELSGVISHEMNSAPGLYVRNADGTLNYVAPEILEDREADLESELSFMQRMQRRALRSPQGNALKQEGIVAWIVGKLEEIVLVVVECESLPSTSGVHRSTWFVPTERTMAPGKSIPTYMVSENWRIPVTTHINEAKLRCSLYYNAVRCPPCRYGVRLSSLDKLIPLTDDGWDTAEKIYRRMQVFRSIRTFPEDGEEQPPLFDRVVTVVDLEVHIMSRAGVMVKYNLPRFHEEFDRVAMINRAELHKRLRMIAQAGREKTARVSLHRTRQGESSLIASAVRDDATLIPDTEMTFKKAKNKPPYLLCYDKRSGSYEIRMDGLPAWPSLYLDDKDRVLAADYRVKWKMTEFMHPDGIIEVRVAGHCPGYAERPYDETAERVAVVDSQSDQETQYFVRRFRLWITSLPLNTIKIVGLADGQFSLLAVIKQTDTDAAVLWNAAADWAQRYLQSDKAQFTKVAVWYGNDVTAVLKREQIPGRVAAGDENRPIVAGHWDGGGTFTEVPAATEKVRAAIDIFDKAAALSAVRCAVFNAYGAAPYAVTDFPLALCYTHAGVEPAEHVKSETPALRFIVESSGEIRLISPEINATVRQQLAGDEEEDIRRLSVAAWQYAARQAMHYLHTGAISDDHAGWRVFEVTRGQGLWQPVLVKTIASKVLPRAEVAQFVIEQTQGASTLLRWILISCEGEVYLFSSDSPEPSDAKAFFGMRWLERTILSKGWHMPRKAGTPAPTGTRDIEKLNSQFKVIPDGCCRQAIVRVSTNLSRSIVLDEVVCMALADETDTDLGLKMQMRELALGPDDLCLVGLTLSGRILFRYQADSMSSADTETTAESLMTTLPVQEVASLVHGYAEMRGMSFGKVRVREWNAFLDKVAQVLRCSEALVFTQLWHPATEDQRDREIKLLREQKTKLQLGVTQLIQQLRLIEEPLVGDPTQIAFIGRMNRDVVTVLCELAGVVTTNALIPKAVDPLVQELKLREALATFDWEAERKAMQEELRGNPQARGPIQVLPDAAVVAVETENEKQPDSVLTSPDFYIESLPFQLRYLTRRASEEQTRFEHKTMTTGHLLLGILKKGTALSNWLRIGHNVELRNARIALELAYKLMAPSLEFQYSPETLKCLRDAEQLAKEQKVTADDTHLLEAILAHKEHMGCKVLDQLKVDRELLVKQIQEARKQTETSPPVYLEEQAYEQFTMTVPPGKQRDDQADALAGACMALSAYPGMSVVIADGFLGKASAADLKLLLRDMTDVIVANPPCGGDEAPVKKYTDLLTERLDLLRDFDSAYCPATSTRLQLAGKAGKTNPEWLETTAARLASKLEQLPPEKRTPIMAAICILDHEMHSKLAKICRAAAMELPVLPFEPAPIELVPVNDAWADSLCRLRNSDIDSLYRLVLQLAPRETDLSDLKNWYNQYRGRRI